MTRISLKRYRFPAEVIRHAVWLYFRITLSLRDVEEMLAQRRISVRYEIIRCVRPADRKEPAQPQGAALAALAPRRDARQHEWQARILWRAVDDEGEVLDLVMQKRRNTGAALTLLKRLLRNQDVEPESIVTDGLKSYGTALRALGIKECHRQVRRGFLA